MRRRWEEAEMAVKDFRGLEVYKVGYSAAMEVFGLSQRFPRDEQFSLATQIRRSSRSVNANLAEAWRKRRYEAHFISKLTDADAEAAETQVWLDFACDCRYIDAETRDRLNNRFNHVYAMLTLIIRDAPRWCSRRED